MQLNRITRTGNCYFSVWTRKKPEFIVTIMTVATERVVLTAAVMADGATPDTQLPKLFIQLIYYFVALSVRLDLRAGRFFKIVDTN
jgi:hypothetical protein